MRAIEDRHLLWAAAVLAPPRAATTRRFLRAVAAETAREISLDAIAAWRHGTLPQPVHDDASAARRLIAEDLGPMLELAPALRGRLASWVDPQRALDAAVDSLVRELTELGVATERPTLHIVERLPGPYDHPTLACVSLDAADAAEYAVSRGLYYAAAHLAPFASEATLGHALVHTALGQRSPRLLGRGLEEGVAEVVGAILAAGRVVGAAETDADFAARRLGAGISVRREELLAQTRAVAAVHARHGLDGLRALVASGRESLKAAEAAVSRGQGDALALGDGAPDPALARRLRSLLDRPRPFATRPLAFYMARAVRLGVTVATAAAELEVPRPAAEAAVRDLTDRLYLLISTAAGIAASDLDLVLAGHSLRYDLAVAPTI